MPMTIFTARWDGERSNDREPYGGWLGLPSYAPAAPRTSPAGPVTENRPDVSDRP